MVQHVGTKELVSFLKKRNTEGKGFITQLKIGYRPVICPFDDLLNFIPEGAKVFDVGCGSGMFLSLVQAYRKPTFLGGVEISEELVTNAKELLENSKNVETSLSVFDGMSFPEFMNKAQYVFLIDVLHHVPKHLQSDFLRAIYMAMADGATLVVKDIDGSNFLSYWNKIHDALLAGEIGVEPKPKLLKSELENLGFNCSEIEKRRMLLYPHFTIYCKKD